jgi:pyridoxamine-phosphate oxidase
MSGHAATLSGDASLELPEFDRPPADPIAVLREWIDAAVDRGVREPLAVSLATADGAGRASSRVVLVKDVSDRGLLIGTHRASAKGRDFAVQPWAAATFYWRETLQQINLAGPVEQSPDEESNRLFHARPLAAQATTAASRQSQPLPDAQELRARTAALAESATSLPRPEGWAAYRLVPEWIEFWHGSPDRLHRRLRYDRGADGQWGFQRLQP